MRPQPSGSFVWVQAAGGQALVCGALRPFADHLFTTRDWALGSRATATDADWDPVAASLGIDRARLVRVHQVHGASVVVRRAGDSSAPESRADADVIVSNDPSLALVIHVADCVPLLVADRATGAAAAAHAGWRGLAACVPAVTVAALTREFGSRPADLLVAIGPCISAGEYEVGDDVRARFLADSCSDADPRRWFHGGDRAGRWHLDLWQAARDQLESAGVPATQIHLSALCTARHPGLLCSYRRDGTGAGRLAAGIRCASPRP